MQNLRVSGKSISTQKENFQISNDHQTQYTENSNSSDEYEEETHISYNFRRWANQIWNVSNNVTSKLKDLLSNNPSSNTTINNSVKESSCEDERNNTTDWSMSNDFVVSSNPIKNGDCNTKRYYQKLENHHIIIPQENDNYEYSKKFNHTKKKHQMHNVTANRVEIPPDIIMGHDPGVTPYSPVLVLPRIHQRGVNRQSMDISLHQSRNHRSYNDMRGNEFADKLYQQNHYSGKRFDYEWSRSKKNYPCLSDRCNKIPDKLMYSMNCPKIKRSGMKSKRTENIDSKDYDGYELEKHFGNRISNFHTESCRNKHKSISQVYGTRRSRDKTFSRLWTAKNYRDNNTPHNSNDNLEPSAHIKAKKVIWDMKLSDIKSHNDSISSVGMLSAKSSITLNIKKKTPIMNHNVHLTLEPNENVEVEVKDEGKHKDIVIPPECDIKTVEHPKISHYILKIEKNNCGKGKDDLINDRSIKQSFVTENSVDTLLQSLRERMNTLGNIHSMDTETMSSSIKYNRKEDSGLSKECIMASCLAGNYYPQYLESQNKMAAQNPVRNKEEIRPSFSDRIQDIWQSNKVRLSRDSPRHQIFSSRYNLKAEEDVTSKFSLLGINQQPVLQEYLKDHNDVVKLTQILEKLIDCTKSRSDIVPSSISDKLEPQPKINHDHSKTCLMVNVGVQKSTPMFTSSSQNPASYSKHSFLEKQRFRQVADVSIEAPKQLQIFSGHGIMPISSIQFTPYPDNPVFQEANPQSVVDDALKCSSFSQNHCSPSSTRELLISHDMKNMNQVEMNQQAINRLERISSPLVVKKIEHKQQQRCGKMSQMHSLHYSTPVSQQESTVTKDRSADTVPRGICTKGHCSWWKKKFHCKKRSNLKIKMPFFFKCVSKENRDNLRDKHSQTNSLKKILNENIVPIPPIRVRRKCDFKNIKFHKSIQSESNKNVLPPIEQTDSFQVTENQQLHRSTSVGPASKMTSVATGTNTILKESRKTNTKLSLINKTETLNNSEFIQVLKQDCNALSNELPTALDRISLESDIVAEVEENSELSSVSIEQRLNDVSLPYEKVSGESENYKVPRIFPKILKPLNHPNDKRPYTLPMIEKSSNYSIRSKAFSGELEVVKSVERECANSKTANKTLFKHNKSSLLRANNSMSRKCATGHFCMTWNTMSKKNMNRRSISQVLTIPLEIKEEKIPLNLSLMDENSCNKLTVTEIHLEYNKINQKMKIFASQDDDLLETHSTSSSMSMQETKRILSLMKLEYLTDDEETTNLSISSPNVDDEIKTPIDNWKSKELNDNQCECKDSMNLKTEKNSLAKTNNTEEIIRMVSEVIELVINESVNKCINSSLKKLSELSLKSIIFRTETPIKSSLIKENNYSTEVNEKLSILSCSSNHEIESIGSQNHSNIGLKKTCKPIIKSCKNLSKIENNHQRRQQYLKYLNESQSLRKKPPTRKTSEDTNSRSTYSDNKLEVTKILSKILNDKNMNEVITLRMESRITFELIKMMNKSEIISPSKFDNNIIKKLTKNLKIDDKPVEEKIKCSIKNGIPLTKIIITDPLVIEQNLLNENNSISEKMKLEKLDSKIIITKTNFLNTKNIFQYKNNNNVSKNLSKHNDQIEENLENVIDKNIKPVINIMSKSELNKKSTKKKKKKHDSKI